MKRVLLIASFFILTMSLKGYGQSASDGVVIYSLPNTTITLEVEAVREVYTAGPYARYADKYLGVEAKESSETKFELLSIKATPYIEADQSVRMVANLSSFRGAAAATFFEMSAQGIVILADESKGGENSWRFPPLRSNSLRTAEATSNLASTEATLYKSERTSSGSERVAITQTQVVQKSAERKAQETADAIFALRDKRLQIITGDTDASFAGEALKAAIDEINRLESEYLSLFLGTTEQTIQSMSFDVVPKADNSRQMYIAFRLSETQGLLPSNNMGGRPIVLELSVEESPAVQTDIHSPKSSAKVSGKEGSQIFYRVPAICQMKIMDGQQILMQSRIPIYQLGEVISFPTDVVLK